MAEENNKKVQYALKKDTVLVDRYVIKEVLGQNGLSITYKAYDTFREKVIALKELYPSAIVARNFDDGLNVECVQLSNEELFEGMKQRCIQKAKTMIKLYPLIGMANIIHYIETNQTVYLVMEYVEGIDLPTFFKRKYASKMELNKTIELLQPVLDSLEQIHKAGIFHGRISPDSIVLDSKRHAILLGFGDPMEEVAQDVLGENTAREFAFAPVEQYVPGGMQGATTDVYAIGAVVYLCVTGVWPPAFYERVGGVTGEADPLKSPWDLQVPIMKSQSDAIMKALAVYTFDRYQSVYEFIDALELDEFSEEQTAVIRNRMPIKFIKKQRRRRIAIAAMVAVVIFAIAFFAPRIYRGGIEQGNDKFYASFEQLSLYDKCVVLSGLTDKEKSRYGNNYEAMTEDGDYTIRYYDLEKDRFVSFEDVSLNQEDYKYLCLDFRTGKRVIMTYLTPAGKETYEMYLNKNGSYYRIDHTIQSGGTEQPKECLQVSAQNPDGQ